MEEHICSGHCSCHHSDSECNKSVTEPILLTPKQKDFLLELSLQTALPVARFLICSDIEDDFVVEALAPAYILSPDDTMETVKQQAAFLTELEQLGCITFAYGTPISKYPYLEYTKSDLYGYFEKTVKDGASRPNFLGNLAVLERGSMQITNCGQRSLAIS